MVDGAESFKHPEVGKEMLWVTHCLFIVALKPNDVPVTCSIYVEDVLLPQLFQVLGSCEDKKGA